MIDDNKNIVNVCLWTKNIYNLKCTLRMFLIDVEWGSFSHAVKNEAKLAGESKF